jgi:hypothetical protein
MLFSQTVFQPKDVEPRIMMILLTSGDLTVGFRRVSLVIRIGCFVKIKIIVLV